MPYYNTGLNVTKGYIPLEWFHEEIEEFGQNLVGDPPAKWCLSGQLIFGPFAESGEYALSYFWEDDDIAAFETGQRGKEVPKTPEGIALFDPEGETDKTLEEYRQTEDPERRRNLGEGVERMGQRQ